MVYLIYTTYNIVQFLLTQIRKFLGNVAVVVQFIKKSESRYNILFSASTHTHTRDGPCQVFNIVIVIYFGYRQVIHIGVLVNGGVASAVIIRVIKMLGDFLIELKIATNFCADYNINLLRLHSFQKHNKRCARFSKIMEIHQI